jgi:hypothetical protein
MHRAKFFVVGARQDAWQPAGMSVPAPTDPNVLRPLLHERVDQWAADDLPLLHRVMLELERDRLVAELNAEFDRDRESGRLARLPEIIRAARAALALRPPGPA